MSRLRRLGLQLLHALRPDRSDADVDREVAAHLGCLEDDFAARGLPSQEARIAAMRVLGGTVRAKELHRDARSLPWLDHLWRDLREARRSLVRSRRWTVIATLILATATAVNAVILGIADGVLLRPLPYWDADRVFVIMMQSPATGERATLVSWEVLQPLSTPTPAISAVAAFQGGRSIPIATEDGTTDVTSAAVTVGYFDVLGVRPALGRFFNSGDAVAGSRAVLLSHAGWVRWFGSDPEIIGRSATVGDITIDVVGVLPPGLFVPTLGAAARANIGSPEIIRAMPLPAPDGRSGTFYPIVRLASDVSLAQAQAHLQALTQLTVREEGSVPVLEPVRAVLFPTGAPIMRLLLASAVALLVLACVNMASLLLVRGHSRSREVGVRLALGASWTRIVRPLFFEVLLIVAAGGALSLLAASLVFDALLEQVPRVAYGNAPVGIDIRVAALTMGLALVTGVGFAFVPAWRAWRRDALLSMRAGPGQPGSAPAWRFGRPLLALQVGLAVVLVFGAIIAARAFVAILQTPLGFDSENVIAFSLRPAPGGDSAVLYEGAFDVLGRHPETLAVGAMGRRPFDGRAPDDGVRRDDPSGPLIGITHVLPGFDAAIGLPLVRGRSLVPADVRDNPDAALVSLSAARALFGEREALGGTFDNGRGRTFQVVGVVGDLRHSLDGLDRDTAPAVYAISGSARQLSLLVRVRQRREPLPQELRREIVAMAPGAIVSAAWWSDAIANVTAYRNPRFQTLVLGTLGTVALGLTAFGVFGVVAFLVAARTRELGIRAAIGATPRSLVVLAVRQAFVPVLTGTVLGLIATRWAARFAEAQLFEMDTRDPLVLAATALAIVTATAAAAYLPARRAGRVDPVRVLRAE